jgi:hypothetical protein
MATDPKFGVELKSPGEFFVGPGKANQFVLSITYDGADAVRCSQCTFWLKARIGSDVKALVLSESMAETISITRDSEQFRTSSYLDPDSKNQFVWEMSSYDETPFAKLTITFSGIESNTKPGTGELIFEAETDNKEQHTLSLSKTSDEDSGIIYFFSTTDERLNSLKTNNSIFPADEQILSRESVTLNWSVKNLPISPSNPTLKRGGIAGISLTDDERAKGEKKVSAITEDTDFVLSALGKQGEISAKVSVKVLQPGWHDSTATIGDAHLEPTCLFNSDAGNSIVFVIFRRTDSHQGLLFKTENPFWGWTRMPWDVPVGLVTSPGVYYDNKLWLIGGSQIDPEITSNEVWYIEPSQSASQWIKLESPSPWSRRMGHAVLVYKQKIWVMGGCDENGNALNDLSSFDVSTKQWSEPASAPWSKRCMFSAVTFNSNQDREIWVYGGVTEPLSSDFRRDLYIYRDDRWEGPVLPRIREPGAVCLQVFREKNQAADRVHLIGQAAPTADTPFTPLFYVNNAATRPDSWTELPSDQLKGWAADLTVVYQLVNFKNKFLIAQALGDNSNSRLKIFVP